MTTALKLKSIASVDTPGATYGRLYYKTDKKPYFKNEDGTDYDLTGAASVDGDVTADTLTLNDGSELTIASAAITVTAARHTIDTESDAASDDLETANGLAANEVCFITANNAARTVVIKHSTGNITCVTGTDISLDDAIKGVLLMGNTAGTGVNAYPVNGGSGGGGIGGSTGATDNALLRADGTGGSTLQSSAASIDDSGRLKTAFFGLPTVAELTISSGAVTATQSYHSVDTEGDAASDDLDTISGGSAGDRLYIFPNNDTRTIVVKNGTDNIFTYTGQDIALDEDHKHLELLCDGTNWYEVSSSGTIAGTVGTTDNTVPRADGTGGYTLQGSAVTIDDNNRLSAARFALPPPTELTISSGSVTAAQMYHSIDTESDAASDDLDTIAGGSAGDVLYIYAVNDTRTVTVKNGTGNILTYSGDDIELDEDHKIICLISDGTNWREAGNVKEGAGGGGGTPSFGTPATKTLSSDAAAAGSDRNLVIAAETGTADDFIELTGLSVGDKVWLRADTGDTITLKHDDAGATVKFLTLSNEDIYLDKQHPLEFSLVASNELIQTRPAALPSGSYEADEGSNWTSSSTSFADIDATELSLTIVTNGGDMMVGFAGSVSNSVNGRVLINVALDGSDVAANDGIFGNVANAATPGTNASFVYLLTDVEPGSHTVKLRWRVTSGTATLWAGAGSTGGDIHPQFWVKEVV